MAFMDMALIHSFSASSDLLISAPGILHVCRLVRIKSSVVVVSAS